MLNHFQKYKKQMLMVLAAFLIVAWVIMPQVAKERADEAPVAKLYGTNIYNSDLQSMAQRWENLGLVQKLYRDWFSLGLGYPRLGAFELRALYIAAKHNGVAVSKDAVANAVKKDPPYMRRIEYVVSDSKDPQKGFAQVTQVREAAAKGATLNAIQDAAKKNPELKYELSNMFTEEGAYYAMPILAEPSTDISKAAALPKDLEEMLFAIPVGDISPVMKSGNRFYFFRVRQASAGINSLGQLVPTDESYVYETGKFAVINTYKDYASLLRAKRSLEFAQVSKSYEEYLVIVKYLELTMGGSLGKVLVPSDTLGQIEEMSGEQANSRLITIPVHPFRQSDAAPDQKALLSFYNERKSVEGDYRRGITGYLQPRKVKIEYIELGLDEFFQKSPVGDDVLMRYYESNRSKFTDPEGVVAPFAAVRQEVEKKYLAADARKKAEIALKAMISAKNNEADAKKRMQLDDKDFIKQLADKNKLDYKTSEFFSPEDAFVVAPGISEHPQFLEIAFSDRAGDRSPILGTDQAVYIFRVIEQKNPEALEFDKLSAAYQARVESDFAMYQAGERAKAALLAAKAGAAREILKTVASENGRVIKATELATAKELPQPVMKYMTANVRPAVGEIAKLIKADDQWYTAVITKIDPASNDMSIEYFTITPETFIAEPKFNEKEVEERARADYKKEKLAEPDSVTPAMYEAARVAMRDEWRKLEFPAKYRMYFGRKAAEIIPRYMQEHPAIIEGDTQLKMMTSPFFRKDDEFIFKDKSLAEAAFKLEAGKITAIPGEKSAVVMLLDKTDKKLERNTEFITVDLSRFDQLAVQVSDDEAKMFYEANPEQFSTKAGATAEYIFASFDDAAKALESKITDAEITAHFEANKQTTYIGRAFDDELKGIIRRLLAKKKSEDYAKNSINLAHKIALQPANSTFALIPSMITEDVRLKVGITPLVSAADTRIVAFGNAPGLVKRINEATVGIVSAPVVTAEGWVIFRVIDKVEAKTPKFEDIAGKVREAARKSALAARARAALEDARQYVEKNPGSSLEDALNQPEIASQLPYLTPAIKTGFVDFESALSWFNNATLREAVFDAQPGKFTETIEAEGKVSIARVIASEENPLVRVHYAEVPAALFSGFFDIDDKAAREHYDAHKADFTRKPGYEVEYLVAERMYIAQTINPSREEILAAYEQTKEQYRLPGQEAPMSLETVGQVVVEAIRNNKATSESARLIEAAAKDIKGGKALSAVAKENVRYMKPAVYTPKGAGNPYELEMVAGLDKFLASAKEGDVSPVLETRNGPAIVKLVKKVAENIPAFEDCRAEVKAAAALQKGLDRAKETALAVVAKAKAQTVPALVEASTATVVKSLTPQPMFTMETGFISRFDPRMRPFAETLFVLEPGQMMEQPFSDERTAVIGYVIDKRNITSIQAERERDFRISSINLGRLSAMFDKINQDLQKE